MPQQSHIVQVALTANLTVAEAALESALAATPAVVGEELARQINEYVHKERLGYYPALDYFDHLDGAVEDDLLDTVKGISWFVLNLARSEVLHRLRPAFSHVDVKDVRLVAFTMPAVRPSQPNALYDLARHYTPDVVKVVLQLASIEATVDAAEGFDREAEDRVRRWLKEHFDGVSVTSSQVI